MTGRTSIISKNQLKLPHRFSFRTW